MTNLTIEQIEAFDIGYENGKAGVYLPYNFESNKKYYDRGFDSGVEAKAWVDDFKGSDPVKAV